MDGRFGQWLRNSIPEVSEDRVRSEVQLAVLKERLRSRKAQRRKRMTRYGMAVIPVVLVAVITTSVVDLGGDGFELEELGSFGSRGDYFKNAFRGTGFSVQDLESEEEIQEFNHQLAAGQGVAVGVEGWEINGKTNWTILKEFSVFGKIIGYGSDPHSPRSQYPAGLLNFLQNHREKYQSLIESGAYQVAGRMNKEFDGTQYIVIFWTIPTTEFGSVTYYRGKPTP